MSATAPLADRWRARLRGAAFMSLRDIGLFRRSARTDAAIARLRPEIGARAAFERVYRETGDPWASGAPQYRYQRRKYATLMALLPAGRRYAQALDIGCGLGAMVGLLEARADSVLGLDVAQAAVDLARARHQGRPALSFAQGDVLDLPRTLDGRFDLIVVSDVLYYLSPLSDATLKGVAARVGQMLAPGGLCLLANHFFFAADRESRVSQRIHRAFGWSVGMDVVSEHRRPFYLATVLRRAAA